MLVRNRYIQYVCLIGCHNVVHFQHLSVPCRMLLRDESGAEYLSTEDNGWLFHFEDESSRIQQGPIALDISTLIVIAGGWLHIYIYIYIYLYIYVLVYIYIYIHIYIYDQIYLASSWYTQHKHKLEKAEDSSASLSAFNCRLVS